MLVHPRVAPSSCFLFFGCLFFMLSVYSLILYILEHTYALHFLSQVQMVIMFSWWLCSDGYSYSDGDYAQTVTIGSNGYVLDFCQWLMQMVFCWWSYGSQIYFLSSWFVYLEVHSSLRSWYSQHVQKVLNNIWCSRSLDSVLLRSTWYLVLICAEVMPDLWSDNIHMIQKQCNNHIQKWRNLDLIWSHAFAYITWLTTCLTYMFYYFQGIIFASLTCVKSKSKHVNSLEMTEHDMTFIHALHAYSCIHDRYSKIGDYYSGLIFSSKVQLDFSPHMFRDQLWNSSEWYTCKLWPVVWNLFKQRDNWLKTQMKQVMEALMKMSSRDKVQDEINLETIVFISDQKGNSLAHSSIKTTESRQNQEIHTESSLLNDDSHWFSLVHFHLYSYLFV